MERSLAEDHLKLLVFAALLPVALTAGLMDDWNLCQRKVLGNPGIESSRDPFVQYCVGLNYLTGQSVRKDNATAVVWFQKAAMAGQTGAMVALGYSYEKGRGVAVDVPRALDWYRKAASLNYADGLYNLARAYKDGIGMAPNPGEARRYMELAAGAGSEEAKRALLIMGKPSGPAPGGDLFAQGANLYRAKNYAGAFQLFMKAANEGNARAQLQVASQYERGEGVPRNGPEAVRWYQKSAAGGDSQAMKNVGLLYEEGAIVPENWAEALKWYQKSAALFDQEGEFALGRMYEFGMAVPQNRATAIEWFRKAAAQGNNQAAYFARWLADPTNNIGFRNKQEQDLVIAGRLRFAGNLIGADPAGILFHSSQERTRYLEGLRRAVDATESETMWKVRKNNYDSCVSNHGDNCQSPGPPPK
jgi:TPR repeat protein